MVRFPPPPLWSLYLYLYFVLYGFARYDLMCTHRRALRLPILVFSVACALPHALLFVNIALNAEAKLGWAAPPASAPVATPDGAARSWWPYPLPLEHSLGAATGYWLFRTAESHLSRAAAVAGPPRRRNAMRTLFFALQAAAFLLASLACGAGVEERRPQEAGSCGMAVLVCVLGTEDLEHAIALAVGRTSALLFRFCVRFSFTLVLASVTLHAVSVSAWHTALVLGTLWLARAVNLATHALEFAASFRAHADPAARP